MATVHYGRLRGPIGFDRVVAIKRLHAHLAHDREIVTMLADEARMAARVVHPNVVQILDVVADEDELLLVLEYVGGESLAVALRVSRERGEVVPPAIAAAIAAEALRGLHAAHEARDERGELLELVHRDLSPQNILVDENGFARVIDFGIAKARGRLHVTKEGGPPRGKLAYMAPEQVHGTTSRRSDIFSMGIVLWETLVGARLFEGETNGEILTNVLRARVPAPSARGAALPADLEQVVLRSLRRDPNARFQTALEMALAIERSTPTATRAEVAAWLGDLVGERLERRREEVRVVEAQPLPPDDPPSAAALPARSPPPRTELFARRRAWIAALVLVLLGAGLFVATRARHLAASPNVAAPDAGEAAEAPASVAPLDADASAGTPAASDFGSPADSAEAPSDEPRPLVRLRAPPPTAPHTTTGKGAPRSACDPPYVVDSAGRLSWKRRCFSGAAP